MTYYVNKRRRRLNFDYSSNALYFVTMNTWQREHHLAITHTSHLELTELGKVVHACWYDIPNHYPNTVLHAFVVMPDHVHVLLELRNNPSPSKAPFNFSDGNPTKGKSPHRHFLSNIIKGFKTGATQWAMANTKITRLWQRSFHDQIIRDERHYRAVVAYIRNNPSAYLRKCRL